MGKTKGMPCSSAAAVSRKSSKLAEQAVGGSFIAGEKAFNFGAQGAANLSNWLEQRYGMSRNERLMIYGFALGAPLALFASPLVGIGLAGALAAPGLRDFLQRRRQQQENRANQSASAAISASLAPVAPVAQQVVDQELTALRTRVAEQNEALQSLIARCRRQQEKLDYYQQSDKKKPQGNNDNPGKLQGLLSLSADRAEAVLQGEQKYILRNGQLRLGPEQRLAVYGQQPAKEIQGTVVAEQIITGSPEEVWQQVGEQLDISQEEFINQCRQAMTKKSQTVSYLAVSKPERLSDPIPFKNSGLTTYDLNGLCYLKPGQHQRHEQIIQKIIGQQKQKPAAVKQ